jgi:N-carbamoyl-L-amino-acid hydrolase
MAALREDSVAAAASVDEQRLWQRLAEMAKIGAIPGQGVNRPALSPEDIEARALLLSWARSLGLAVSGLV